VLLAAAAGGLAFWKFFLPRWRAQPPAASGGELQVHVLDVGPGNGDAILIVSPTGQTVLMDSGDAGKEKVVLEALKRYQVQQLDYFIGTHPHPDHLGAAAAVFKGTKVLNVIDNGLQPAGMPTPTPTPAPGKKPARPAPTPDARAAKKVKGPAQFYLDYQEAIKQSGARYQTAEVGQKLELGGGARLTILAPSQPYFTKEQMKAGGNEPNANSIVARLDYGDFSMLLPGDGEEQTEERLLGKELDLAAGILKVAHHGSKYATSEAFINRVHPEVAIISDGEWNRYGHPAQSVLDRLKAAGVKVYRTDLQGEITIKTNGKAKGERAFEMKTAREPKTDLWVGRTPQKDDASRSGFIAYGDFGPPPKVKPEKTR
jgi:beta-lactamase superfamily II metal-dependent hydrolase